MVGPRLTILGTFLFYLVLGSKNTNFYRSIWTYDEQSYWPGELCQGQGVRQSPINIQSGSVVTDDKKRFIRYGPLQFVGYEKVLLTGINNGHTIQFSTDGDESMHPTITGGPLQHTYRLEQLHFHWLSEHAIDGNKYPMEIHFLHVRTDLSVPDALMIPDGLAILAVFCNVKTHLERATLSTDEIMQFMPHLNDVGNRISGALINTELLLSPNKKSYYTYAGSLTSPACNEVVTWIIFEQPIYTSDAHYLYFSKVSIGRHNFRTLQRMSHHVVYTPPLVENVTEPSHVVKMFNDMVNLLKKAFNNTKTYMNNAFKKMG